MGINFNSPWLLILIPILVGLTFYLGKDLRKTVKKKSRVILITRTIIVVLLILALSGLNVMSYVDTVSTLFVVDLSDSTRGYHSQFKTFIEDALEYKDNKDRVGVITFGQNSEVENPLSEIIRNIEFQTNPGSGFTNIEKSLQVSQALLPDDNMKRIVLLTDGEENVGNSINQGSLLKYNDIDLKVYSVTPNIDQEVQLKSIEVPRQLYENQSFDVVVQIYSNIKTDGSLTLYSGRDVVGQENIEIEKGTNKYVFRDKALNSGLKAYRAVITAEADTITQNNQYSTFTEVRGTPNVLLIDGDNEGGREIYKILAANDIRTDYIKDREAPRSIAELSNYSTIIMSDVSLDNVNIEFINSLKSYVRDYGGGLVVTGGENSYALGGYYKTPLEEILPVDMEMKNEGEVPNLGLVLVIDKSGSMEGGQYGLSKVEIAKEAAIKAVNSLRPKDQIGILAFDGAAQWVHGLSSVEDENEIISSIGTIRAGGGTSILPALDEAYLSLRDADTKLKHIILLTDGHAESSGYDTLIEEIRKEGITLSTVAVGQDSDLFLLEHLASEGKGRYYFVDEYSTIPQIFTKETFLASKAYINNRTFVPNVGYFHDIISPFVEGIPSLDGYIGTSSKDMAETILVSDKGDPILSTWQYGLGRSVAWTSDANGKWTSSYLSTDRGIEFFTNMIEWTFPRLSDSNIVVEASEVEGLEEIIVKNTKDINEEYDTKATIIAPNLETIEIDLKPTNPGQYKGSFESIEDGVYIVKINQYRDGQIVGSANHGIAVNYSKEFDITSRDNKLQVLLDRADGKLIQFPNEIFTKDLTKVYGSRDLTGLLIILSMLLFIFDIALRRLNIRFKRLEILSEKVEEGINKYKKSKTESQLKNIKNGPKEEAESFNKRNGENAGKEEKTKVTKADKNKLNDKKTDNSLDTSRLMKAKDKRKK